MFESEKSTALTKYFQTKLAVVEVEEGESQEEAWHRYLTLHPEDANTHIKIFHYPAKNSLDKERGRLESPSFQSTGGRYVMAESLIKKVQRGYQVDGINLLGAFCNCGGNGAEGYEVADCCHTYSSVRLENHTVSFFAKATTPNTRANYEWGYRVKKGLVEVDVLVYDTRNPKSFKFGGSYPPSLSEWEERGWQVLDRFERPLGWTRVKMPGWSQTPEAYELPE